MGSEMCIRDSAYGDEWTANALAHCQSETGAIGPDSALIQKAWDMLGVVKDYVQGTALTFELQMNPPGEPRRRKSYTFEWIGHVWQLKSVGVEPDASGWASLHEEAPETAQRLDVEMTPKNIVVYVHMASDEVKRDMLSPPVSLHQSKAFLKSLGGFTLPNPAPEGHSVAFCDRRGTFAPVVYTFSEGHGGYWHRSSSIPIGDDNIPAESMGLTCSTKEGGTDPAVLRGAMKHS